MAEGNDQYGNPVAQDVDGTKWKFVFTFDQTDFDMDYEHCLSNYKMANYVCKHCRAANGKHSQLTRTRTVTSHHLPNGDDNA